MQDLRYAIRQLRKNSGFALTTILTLALGIGATTAIFSLVNAVLLRPLPFPEQDRLMWLHQQDHSLPGIVPEALSYPDYFDWRAQNHTFSGIASYHSLAVTLETSGEAQHLDAQTVSANLFQVLGVAPMLGRDLRWDDEKPGNHTVMLSYSLWQSSFGSAKDIAGTTIKLGNNDYVVAGVMPKSFQFPLEGPAPALWVSLADDTTGKSPSTGQRGNDSLSVIGRLKPGVTLEQAKADLNLVAVNLARQYPDSNKWYTSALMELELQHMIGDTRVALRVLFGAVTLVLLIACANVAGLLLARGSRRSAEFALRAAIGASRAEIIRQLLVESVVLSLCGGVAGVALAFGLLRGMVRLMLFDIPRVEYASIDASALVFAMVISVVTGLLFGVLPAWRMSHLEPVQALREGTRSVAGSRGQHRLHNGLVVAQTAIGLVLLVGSGLLIRSFVHILNVDPGFDPRRVLTARVGVPFDRLAHDQHLQFYNQLVARLSTLPGVQSVSAGWPLPMSDSNASVSFSIAGKPIAKADHPSESIGIVLPGYFATMRIPLLSGRTFGEQDGTKTVPVMMINQAFARKYFPGENPIGKHIQADLGDDVIEHPMREVVGVVGDIKRKGLTADVEPQYFLPYTQAVITNPFLTIRTSGDPAAIENALRAAVHEMDKGVPVYQVSTLETYISKSVAQPRFQTLLLSCFAAIALMLSAIGLYGLLSYMVVQRTLEIGLRMALGAQRTDVLRMIVRRGLTLALIGLIAGLAVSAMMARLLSGMLYGVGPSDPVTFATVTALLLLVSLTASTVPAYRAARLDPMETLREQ
ncbi:ABC transporter permease [Granulicella arctica]|uniref:Putative permease n=1 Tax=Granulicella arctica TaxID=940613 RepID=A0A7Y9PK15_9BACT|nr:ABC transporter permease [Granulicella arctica]NYF81286.1 putative permease [Granulicella arctica]